MRFTDPLPVQVLRDIEQGVQHIREMAAEGDERLACDALDQIARNAKLLAGELRRSICDDAVAAHERTVADEKAARFAAMLDVIL